MAIRVAMAPRDDRAPAWASTLGTMRIATVTPVLAGARAYLDTAPPLRHPRDLANHAIVRGRNPFAGVRVDPNDVRRACELQAKSHLIHLREGYLETQGEAAAVARLIAASAAPFRALLTHIARLPEASHGSPENVYEDAAVSEEAERRIGISATLVREVFASATSGQTSIADPTALFSRYLAAAEQVWEYVDAWRA